MKTSYSFAFLQGNCLWYINKSKTSKTFVFKSSTDPTEPPSFPSTCTLSSQNSNCCLYHSLQYFMSQSLFGLLYIEFCLHYSTVAILIKSPVIYILQRQGHKSLFSSYLIFQQCLPVLTTFSVRTSHLPGFPSTLPAAPSSLFSWLLFFQTSGCWNSCISIYTRFLGNLCNYIALNSISTIYLRSRLLL